MKPKSWATKAFEAALREDPNFYNFIRFAMIWTNDGPVALGDVSVGEEEGTMRVTIAGTARSLEFKILDCGFRREMISIKRH